MPAALEGVAGLWQSGSRASWSGSAELLFRAACASVDPWLWKCSRQLLALPQPLRGTRFVGLHTFITLWRGETDLLLLTGPYVATACTRRCAFRVDVPHSGSVMSCWLTRPLLWAFCDGDGFALVRAAVIRAFVLYKKGPFKALKNAV